MNINDIIPYLQYEIISWYLYLALHFTILFKGQFLPASERCDDPLLAVLESPSIVHLLLEQMFMHTKNSSASNEGVESSLAPDHSTSDKDIAGENNSPPTISKKEDDTGGGKIFQLFTNS